ncbi:hypothetical protein G9A89_014796 [Geosiphon pyriformis]|nr:hypothetical protein G9A89_014796 [Geosiphon pyriformis]
MNNHLYKNLSQYLETLQIEEKMPVKKLIKLQKLTKHYFIQNHILYYWNRQNPDNLLRVITTDEKETILFNMHSDIHSGHFGKTATIQRATSHYYWPKMSSDIIQYIRNCDPYQ